MPQNLRRAVTLSCVWGSVAGLLACPQLAQDDFASIASGAGAPGCAQLGTCGDGTAGAASGGGAGSAGGVARAGSSAGGTAGGSSTAGAPAGGAAGASSAGSGPGPGGDAGSAGKATSDAGVTPPDWNCRAIYLEDDTQRSADNCVGVYGWNKITTDTGTNPATTVSQAYRDGQVCFTGRIVAAGWGAVYNFTLQGDGGTWDATEYDVDGLQLEFSGALLPTEIEVKYTVLGGTDFCRVITPAASVAIPFASTHQNCSTNPAAPTPDPTKLTYLRLHVPIAASAYDIDFCLGVRAIP